VVLEQKMVEIECLGGEITPSSKRGKGLSDAVSKLNEEGWKVITVIPSLFMAITHDGYQYMSGELVKRVIVLCEREKE